MWETFVLNSNCRAKRIIGVLYQNFWYKTGFVTKLLIQNKKYAISENHNIRILIYFFQYNWRKVLCNSGGFLLTRKNHSSHPLSTAVLGALTTENTEYCAAVLPFWVSWPDEALSTAAKSGRLWSIIKSKGWSLRSAKKLIRWKGYQRFLLWFLNKFVFLKCSPII